jgi:hypothetical protein
LSAPSRSSMWCATGDHVVQPEHPGGALDGVRVAEERPDDLLGLRRGLQRQQPGGQ